LLFGAGAVVLGPNILRVSHADARTVRWAIGFAVAGVFVDSIGTLPGNILRAENKEYRATVVQLIAPIASGIGSILALHLGWGLPGVFATSIPVLIVAGCARYVIARRNISWLGVSRVSRQEVRRFARLASRVLLSSFTSTIFFGTDILIATVL